MVVLAGKVVLVIGQKLLYSAKVVAFGNKVVLWQSDCIRAKFGKSCLAREIVVFGQSCGIAKNWLY